MTETDNSCNSAAIIDRLRRAGRLWLFLDYDGTLADFAPTPDHVYPDPELAALLRRLARDPRLRLAVVSGRRLAHVQKLVPVPGILLAGTYGLELQTPEGGRIDRLAYEDVRPALDALKSRWRDLLAGREGFYLEDKGWALAIHARAADETTAHLLSVARELAVEVNADADLFRVVGDRRFLEMAPRLAHKGRTVRHLLAQYPWPGALPLYLGDDAKDEEAFGVIREKGGITILVSPEPRPVAADCRLKSPQAARRWLAALPGRLATAEHV